MPAVHHDSVHPGPRDGLEVRDLIGKLVYKEFRDAN